MQSATVNSRSKSNDIINEGGSVLYPRPSRGSRYLAHKLLLLIHQAHALDNPTLRYIIALLADNPGLYLDEICSKIRSVTGVTMSRSTVCRVLKRNGFTRKKITQVAKQRCAKYRGAFMT